MIEKAFLPVRLVSPEMKQFFANEITQGLDPGAQGDAGWWESGKQVNVIRHYDIVANGDIMLLGLR